MIELYCSECFKKCVLYKTTENVLGSMLNSLLLFDGGYSYVSSCCKAKVIDSKEAVIKLLKMN
jgi:hypothetical protein